MVDGSDGTVREMVRRLVAAGLGVDAVIPAREQGLEDYFLGLTQSSGRRRSRRKRHARRGGAR